MDVSAVDERWWTKMPKKKGKRGKKEPEPEPEPEPDEDVRGFPRRASPRRFRAKRSTTRAPRPRRVTVPLPVAFEL